MAMSIQSHIYVPKHIKATDAEIEEILKKYNITKKQLPKIQHLDPVAKELEAKVGDVIKVTRKSPTNIKFTVYRMVV